MSKRTKWLLGIGAIAALIFGLQVAAYAVSLPGSQFEIDNNANLINDASNPLPLDWANVAEIRQADKTSGSTDDSFGNGAKEDTAVPSVVNGSIPPNKSDLLNFGVYLDSNADGDFLNVFWHRVQEPQGTTNMDFEFNQSSTLSSNGVTPVRTAGDVLIQYDLSQGGTNPQLFLSRWLTTGAGSLCEASNSTPCWSDRINLSAAGDATGSINTTAIPAAQADGLGNISARTFGEAQIDLNALTGGGAECVGFGSAYLKSRSSDSFTAALKDFIAPKSVNINRCGGVHILKTDDATPANPLEGATFSAIVDAAPTGPPKGAEDTVVADTCTTVADGTCTISGLIAGPYWIVETTTPAGHETAPDQHVDVTASDTPIELTFVDPRQTGAIEVTKTRKHAADGAGDHPQAGVDFTVNGVTKATDANGKACFDGLQNGDYTVHETVPAGYNGEDDKTVTVNNPATCAATPYGGETVAFHNTPLSNITVSFESQVTGGTASTIGCTGLTANPADGTPAAFDDTSETFEDLEPGTYTCTVVVDP